MKKVLFRFFLYLARKLRLSTGCDAPFKTANAIEPDLGDSELAVAIVEILLDRYNDLTRGKTPFAVPSTDAFHFLILDRPLTRVEIAFIATYHFEARCSTLYPDPGHRTTYYFYSLHSLYYKRKL